MTVRGHQSWMLLNIWNITLTSFVLNPCFSRHLPFTAQLPACGKTTGPSYQRQCPSALDSIFLIVNFHSCVTVYPGSFTTMDLHCYFLEMHPLFICCINQASKMKGEFHALNLGESIKANAILSVWWHLWSLSMPFSTHLPLHEIIINILLSSFTLPIWGCDWS